MPIWLIVACVVLLLLLMPVVAIIVVKMCCPTAFFKYKGPGPPGFVLWAIAGGHVPPYFAHWPWENKWFRKWCKDGDVVCCVAAKSGTTWLMNIVHQIRTHGDPNGFLKHNTHTTPWPEFVWYPGQTPEESFDVLMKLEGMTNPAYPFRVFKSHYLPLDKSVPWEVACKTSQVVPVREHTGIKYIACMRDGLDTIASFYPFFNSIRDEFREMWGGFPPVFPNYDACFDFCTSKHGFFFPYVKGWWPYRHDPNVLLLHYADLKKDIKGQLRRIADFLGVSVPAAAWPLIEEKVSLKWMKANESVFKHDAPFTGFGNIMKDDEGSMIRKGANGDGKGRLSPEQEKVWESLNEKFFGAEPGLKEWIKTGGPLPPLTEKEKDKAGKGWATYGAVTNSNNAMHNAM